MYMGVQREDVGMEKEIPRQAESYSLRNGSAEEIAGWATLMAVSS